LPNIGTALRLLAITGKKTQEQESNKQEKRSAFLHNRYFQQNSCSLTSAKTQIRYPAEKMG